MGIEITPKDLFSQPIAGEVVPDDFLGRANKVLDQVASLLGRFQEVSESPIFQQLQARFQGTRMLNQAAANKPTAGEGQMNLALTLIMQKWGKKTINEILKEIGPLTLEEAIRKALGG